MTIDRVYGPYAHLYEQFFRNRHHHKGYHFGEAPAVMSPPVSIQFPRSLRWWSWDRPQRLRALGKIRDRRLQEIISLGQKAQNSPMGANPHPFPVSRQTYERKRKGFPLIISANSPPLQIFFRRRLA